MTARLMSDPQAMRDLAGRFEEHVQTLVAEAYRMCVSSQHTLSQAETAFRSIVSMLDWVREGLVGAATRCEQQMLRNQFGTAEQRYDAANQAWKR